MIPIAVLRRSVLIAVASVLAACSSLRDAPSRGAVAAVPAPLATSGKQVLFRLRGEGVQIYVGAQQEGRLQWVLQAPQADLLDYRTGEKVGTHGAGPTWTAAADGSVLKGTKVAAADAPEADAVPWLLLATKAENGGRFANVTHIQRVDTWGGRAPGTPPAQVGETRQVRYEATYLLLGDG
jgi:hypothetical protein